MDLVWQFLNPPGGRHDFEYDLVKRQVGVPSPTDGKEGVAVKIEAVTPIILPTETTPIAEIPLRAYGTVSKKEIRAAFKSARMARAEYLAHPTPQPWEDLIYSSK